ncbi:MAG: hypothetical protein K8T90_16725 [Planctomycetes bacterium]|nr:hypothetical protein [Planctomycetota bacterium]
MTHPTDRPKTTDDAAKRAAKSAQEQPPVETSRTESQPAAHHSVQSAQCATSAGSKSAGSLPAANPPEEPRPAKTRTTVGDAPSRAPLQSLAPVGPVSPKGHVEGLRTPTQSLGARQIKGDDNRAVQAKSLSSGESRTRDVSASASPSSHTLTRPTDPTRTGEIDPIQPERSAPTQPAYVVEPTIGQATGSATASLSESSAAAGDSVGDSSGDAAGDSVSAS